MRCRRARLALVRDVLDPGVPGDPLRVRALVDLAVEVAGAGDTDLAFRLLLAAAVRVWSADPGLQTRAFLLAAAGRLGSRPTTRACCRSAVSSTLHGTAT